MIKLGLIFGFLKVAVMVKYIIYQRMCCCKMAKHVRSGVASVTYYKNLYCNTEIMKCYVTRLYKWLPHHTLKLVQARGDFSQSNMV